MQKILGKRILRDLKENLFRYLALGLMIVLGMYMVISLVGAADTIIYGTAESAENQKVEDGQFSLFVPLSKEEKSALTKDGVTLEEHFYLDYPMADASVLRVFSEREKIDLPKADEGRLPKKSGEIFLEKRYCQEHSITTGDEISVGGRQFLVCGIGSSPDYDTPLRNLSDSAVDSGLFGVGFLTREDYSRLEEEKESIRSEEYVYAYLLNGKLTQEELKKKLKKFYIGAEDINDSYFQEYWERTGGRVSDFREALDDLGDGIDKLKEGLDELDGSSGKLTDGAEELSEEFEEFSSETEDFLDENMDTELSKVTQFLPAADNGRIGGAADDQLINKEAGLAAGVILLILIAYVISVFVVNKIEQESGIIGTLYAMGVRKNELLCHYLTLPICITLAAGILGTVVGYSSLGIPVQMRDCYAYFSLPVLDVVYEPYLLLYGIVMPPAAAALTNFLVIRKKLEQPALSLIRKERKNGKVQNITIRHGSFVRIFQIRQILRESRTAFTVFFGMFFSLLIVMLALNCYVLCIHIKTENSADTKFEYMYTYKYPEEEVPEEGEAAYGVTLKKKMLGYNLDVTLLGISRDNPYFEIEGEKEFFSGKNKVQISSAMAQKYRLDLGDDLVLKDEENDINYAFTVEGIVPYSASFFAFMDIDSMRELMGQDSDYYNVVFADHDIGIQNGRLYATVSREEIKKSASVFVNQMMPMVVTLTAVSGLLFVVVMYLMMKVMIDRSAMSISLMKVFGYRKQEIRRLYLNGNLFVVAVSGLLGIPLSKIVMDGLYPYLVSNVACGINLVFPWQMYVGLMGAILVLYFFINCILMRRVNKILPAEVLKNRE